MGAGETLGTGVRPARVYHPPSSLLQKLVARSPPFVLGVYNNISLMYNMYRIHVWEPCVGTVSKEPQVTRGGSRPKPGPPPPTSRPPVGPRGPRGVTPRSDYRQMPRRTSCFFGYIYNNISLMYNMYRIRVWEPCVGTVSKEPQVTRGGV